jgi:hypothetical protein
MASETERIKELEFAIADTLSVLGLSANCPLHGEDDNAHDYVENNPLEALSCIMGLETEASQARFTLLQTGIKPSGFDNYTPEQKKLWIKEYEQANEDVWGWEFSKEDDSPRTK